MNTPPAKPPIAPAENGYVRCDIGAWCASELIHPAWSTFARFVEALSGLAGKDAESILRRCSELRSRPTSAARHTTPPRMQTAALVNIPAINRMIPNARTIGHGAGAVESCKHSYRQPELIGVNSQPGPHDSKTAPAEFS